jgi:hypothetical protein
MTFGGPGHEGPPPQPEQQLFEEWARQNTPMSHHFAEFVSFLGAPKSRVIFGIFCSNFFKALFEVFLARWQVMGVWSRCSEDVILLQQNTSTLAHNNLMKSSLKVCSEGGRHRE